MPEEHYHISFRYLTFNTQVSQNTCESTQFEQVELSCRTCIIWHWQQKTTVSVVLACLEGLGSSSLSLILLLFEVSGRSGSRLMALLVDLPVSASGELAALDPPLEDDSELSLSRAFFSRLSTGIQSLMFCCSFPFFPIKWSSTWSNLSCHASTPFFFKSTSSLQKPHQKRAWQLRPMRHSSAFWLSACSSALMDKSGWELLRCSRKERRR